jgi:UDP-N-acetyl-2-amino-2-deoxyglucuronate dehydrogenase
LKRFAIIGAGGYIAPRHIKAIKETGNILVAALDKHDSVGVLDSYFPSADFFLEFERFDRHLEKLKRQGNGIDYLVVCSPNYLHDAHIRFGLRLGADVICEKPVVLNPWNVDALLEMEKETGKKVFTILQLRHHPSIISLKEKVEKAQAEKMKVDLRYISPRGNWYYISWKGDIDKSGGISSNIGIHFFDILLWIFGPVKKNVVHLHTNKTASGRLELERAEVDWFLSIDSNELHGEEKNCRMLKVNGDEIAMDSFDDLHTICYKEILKGNGHGLQGIKDLTLLLHETRAHQKR